LLFGVENQALVSSWCSLETSCYSSSSNNSTSKLCLILRRGWAPRMEMLPALRENSSSSKHLQEQSSTIWWTNTCPYHSSTALGACFPRVQSMLFIANVAPRVAGEVMTLSPRDNGTCSMCIIKGDNITPSDSRSPRRLCINNA
jgi:hypothetical protein